MPETYSELVLYGISNCDQVKKAKRWLDGRKIEYRFVDFKKESLTEPTVRRWLKSASWEELINRRGTTWRGLDKSEIPADERSAIAIMLAYPSIVKRPVVETNGRVTVGFDEPTFKLRLL